MAVPFSFTLTVLTLPQAVVIALILSKLIVGGKLEIMTRLLVPPALVILGADIGVGTGALPIVGMLLKLLLSESTIRICVKVGAGL
jgi:hypothetical protein